MTTSPLFRQMLLGLLSLSCVLFTSCSLLKPAIKMGMLKLHFGCLVEGTLIDTPTGPVTIENLKTGDLVIGYEGSPVTIQQIHQYQEDPTRSAHLTVSFSNGAEIELSPRHRIASIPAGQLKEGDEVAGHHVTGTRTLGKVTRTFDLLTTDQGYQVQGIPVNSMIEEMIGQ